MESTATKQARGKSVDAPLGTSSEPHLPRGVPETDEKKPAGYGLPCARCHAYYPADVKACPICKSSERVPVHAPVAEAAATPASRPESNTLDGDRERFLKELKSQAFASHTQINTAATFRCVLEHQHNGTAEPAAVCHSCYSEVRQLADRLEAALHIDSKEAAKIVYEAVWADASDPNTTYVNAANALLNELRNRAGIPLILGPNQPLPH